MKTINKGIQMTEEDIEALVARKEEALAKQQARKEKLECTMENTRNDLEQLRFTLHELRRRRARKRPRVFVPRCLVAATFTHLSRLFDRIQRRLHRLLNNTWFCILVNARYTFESRMLCASRRQLTAGTVLGYFKRERVE